MRRERRAAFAGLLACATLVSAQEPAPTDSFWPPRAKQTVHDVWVRLEPGLLGLGLSSNNRKPDEGKETVSFLLESLTRLTPGATDYTVKGTVWPSEKLAAETEAGEQRGFGYETSYFGPAQPFDLAPGVTGLIRERASGPLIAQNNSTGTYSTHSSGGGTAFFRRGLVTVYVDMTRVSTTPTKARERTNPGTFRTDRDPVVLGEESRAVSAQSRPDLEAYCRRIYALVPGGPVETGPRAEVELTLLDPNFLFGPPDRGVGPSGERRDEPRDFTSSYVDGAALRFTTSRVGTAADGVSLLLARAIVPGYGRVTFPLEGAGMGGTLHPVKDRRWSRDYPFDDPGATSLEVTAGHLELSDTFGALALYKPPADFGPAYGARAFTVRAAFTPLRKGKPDGEKTASLTLVRPPVILVHGTYDNPRECWQTISPGAPSSNTVTMENRLKRETFRVFLADYKETSGNADPSSFTVNQQMLWKAPGGIHEALEAFRKDGFAATRADVICHSLGGVLARVYLARNPQKREENYGHGDVNRLITVSSTHRGSEVVELFDAYQKYADSRWNTSSLWISFFLGYVDETQQRIFTGAPLDQVPGSAPLRGIGPTRVRAHAISCVASDEDLSTYGGLYLERAKKLWWAATPEALKLAVGQRLGDNAGADRLIAARAAETALEREVSVADQETSDGNESARLRRKRLRADLEDLQLKNALAFRTVVFRGANDCTVSQTSSRGGLAAPYVTTIGNVLHGFASQYPSVQDRVLEILKSEGDRLLSPLGFPDTYAAAPGIGPTWGQLLGPGGKVPVTPR